MLVMMFMPISVMTTLHCNDAASLAYCCMLHAYDPGSYTGYHTHYSIQCMLLAVDHLGYMQCTCKVLEYVLLEANHYVDVLSSEGLHRSPPFCMCWGLA